MTQELDTLMYKMLSYAKRCMEDGAYASIGEMEAFAKGNRVVLPAYAGMIPARPLLMIPVRRAPRIRGDDPKVQFSRLARDGCSPHTRG